VGGGTTLKVSIWAPRPVASISSNAATPGLERRQDVLFFNPAVPTEVGSIELDIRYRGYVLHIQFTTDLARVHLDLAKEAPITIDIKGSVSTLLPGRTLPGELS
jgi:trehalose/maltose hydrolase-like predicted phosphorylase